MYLPGIDTSRTSSYWLLGAGLLRFGWFGFNGGCGFRAIVIGAEIPVDGEVRVAEPV